MDEKRFMEILSRKDAVYVLLALYRNPGASKSDIMYSDDEKGSRAKFLRIQDFVDYGLATEDGTARRHNTKYVTLTPVGARIARCYEDILKEGQSLPDPIEKEN